MACESGRVKPGKEFIWLTKEEQYKVVVLDSGMVYSSFLEGCKYVDRNIGHKKNIEKYKISDYLKKYKKDASPKERNIYNVIAYYPLGEDVNYGDDSCRIIIEDKVGQYIIEATGVFALEDLKVVE